MRNMKISVKAKPCSKMEKVEKIPQSGFAFAENEPECYKVWVKEKPENGEANEAVVRALAEHFGVRKSDVRLVIGGQSSQKIFEINC